MGDFLQAFYDEGPSSQNYRNLTGSFTEVGCGLVVEAPDAKKIHPATFWAVIASAAMFRLRHAHLHHAHGHSTGRWSSV